MQDVGLPDVRLKKVATACDRANGRGVSATVRARLGRRDEIPVTS